MTDDLRRLLEMRPATPAEAEVQVMAYRALVPGLLRRLARVEAALQLFAKAADGYAAHEVEGTNVTFELRHCVRAAMALEADDD